MRAVLFIRLKKEELIGIVVTESLLAAMEGSGEDKINWAIVIFLEVEGMGVPKSRLFI
jgi:hypothetical protein